MEKWFTGRNPRHLGFAWTLYCRWSWRSKGNPTKLYYVVFIFNIFNMFYLKVGVLLLDTQGLFDGNSTTKQNGNIFTLSTLMSSIQIFNLSQKMQEDNLENLQVLQIIYWSVKVQKTFSTKLIDIFRIWTLSSF